MREKSIPLSDPQAYLRERRNIEDYATIKNLFVKHSPNEREVLKVYYEPKSVSEEDLKSFEDFVNAKLRQIANLDANQRRQKQFEVIICKICKSETKDRYRLLNCEHAFCSQCLFEYIDQKEDCDDLNCITCEKPIALSDILNLFKQSDLEVLYDKFKCKYLIENKNRFRFCPSPNCDNILEKESETKILFCTCCGYDTCFDCSKSHPGADCATTLGTKRRRVSVADFRRKKNRSKSNVREKTARERPPRSTSKAMQAAKSAKSTCARSA